jgi:hypothetical protein
VTRGVTRGTEQQSQQIEAGQVSELRVRSLCGCGCGTGISWEPSWKPVKVSSSRGPGSYSSELSSGATEPDGVLQSGAVSGECPVYPGLNSKTRFRL